MQLNNYYILKLISNTITFKQFTLFPECLIQDIVCDKVENMYFSIFKESNQLIVDSLLNVIVDKKNLFPWKMIYNNHYLFVNAGMNGVIKVDLKNQKSSFC